MTIKTSIFAFVTFLLATTLFAQQETYIVIKASFSSDRYDEFAPAIYKNGIVFCTNRVSGTVNYSTNENEGFYKIFFVDTTASGKWHSPALFSKEIRTKLNDGPATFNSTFDTVFFSRNIVTDKRLKSLAPSKNKLGLYFAVFDGRKWAKISELRFNSDWFNITMPCLSPDGERLFFASDRPDGYGGLDLYFCQWKNGYWDNPVNLGPMINTKGNEGYPFITKGGELFFSSDGHKGYGKKDIFLSRFADTAWLAPVALDPPLNSEFDDFGIIFDQKMKQGYFSSNRERKSLDIFYFENNFQQHFYSSDQRENQYCYTFKNDESIAIDSTNLLYEWDFGDGIKSYGENAHHCFPGPGEYVIKLNIVDRSTGHYYFEKLISKLEIKEIEQPFITSLDVSIMGDTLIFDGLKSNFPGWEIIDYYWDFGDGKRGKGTKVKHAYSSPGNYAVKLGLVLNQDSTGIVRSVSGMKNVRIFQDYRYLTEYNESIKYVNITFPEVGSYDHTFMKEIYSASKDLEKGAVFQLEVLSTTTRIGADNTVFKPLVDKYFVREVIKPEAGIYCYVVDESDNLADLYLTFKDLIGFGFAGSKIQTYIPNTLAEQELLMIKKVYGTSTDDLFWKNDYRLSALGMAMLDQISVLLKKYSDLNLIIAIHTDNIGSPASNLILSRNQTKAMVNYLSNKGINREKLISEGFGGSRPIALNLSMEGRKKNRRLELFLILE